MTSRPRRYDLQDLLKELLGTNNVYYQPPATIKMSYPCIVYRLDEFYVTNANNSMYNYKSRYQITYIDKNPDREVPLKLEALPYAHMNSTFATEGLNHFVFTLYH